MDGDGDTDIATLSHNQIAFFLNDGAADFSPADVIQADDGGWFSTIATGDTNGDGRADVVLVQRGQTAEPRKLIVLQHTGAGFERKDVAAPNVSDPMILLDINGDGHVDALDSSGRAFLGIDGTGNLAEGRLLLEAGVRTLAAGDFDGDDDLDLAYVVQNPATQDNELFVRNNQGGTDFARHAHESTTKRPPHFLHSALRTPTATTIWIFCGATCGSTTRRQLLFRSGPRCVPMPPTSSI